jgi:dTMP kinase
LEGLLVCLEGIDGAGKNTQARLLEKKLKEIGIKSVIYSYPDYTSRYGKAIKEFLDKKIELSNDELVFLHLLDRIQNRASLRKDLSSGKVVITDRYFYSIIAYQGAGGFDYENLKMIVESAGLSLPDIVFYLDVTVDLSIERKGRQKKGKLDRFEAAAAYLNKVRGVYNKLYDERFACDKWIRIDGRGSVTKVQKEIFAEVSKLLGR